MGVHAMMAADTHKPTQLPPSFAILVIEAMEEAEKAMLKFPQPNYVISKFAEEAGEVVKAAIHHAEGRETREAVVSEMRQTLAMMLRLWIEGDKVHGLPAIGGETL
jgi:phosphoribosyl-ATP pyrophosphohydrolase